MDGWLTDVVFPLPCLYSPQPGLHSSFLLEDELLHHGAREGADVGREEVISERLMIGVPGPDVERRGWIDVGRDIGRSSCFDHGAP
mmetsp:Transcript_86091/g.162236  ORF Transcript_86091/g.162236 Transcript_86091/m.162236 type:complete len:86 (+) Transcript_86091:263-520(+)